MDEILHHLRNPGTIDPLANASKKKTGFPGFRSGAKWSSELVPSSLGRSAESWGHQEVSNRTSLDSGGFWGGGLEGVKGLEGWGLGGFRGFGGLGGWGERVERKG